MKEYKFAFYFCLIAGSIFILLSILLNIIAHNSIFVIIFKSLLSGIFIAGITFGIVVFFTKYLGMDFDNINNDEMKDNTDPMVDIVVDDNININNEENDMDNDFNVMENNNKLSSGDNKDNSSNDDTLGDNDFGNDYNDENENNNVETGDDSNKITEDDTKIDLENIDGDLSDSFSLDEDGNDADNGNAIDESDDIDVELKDKVGFEVSFEDVAKAIRTKMRDDD